MRTINSKSLIKIIPILVMLLATAEAKPQYIILNSEFKALDYNEIRNTLKDATDAINEAQDKCYEYYISATKYLEKDDLALAKINIKRAIDLNKRYDYHLVDNKDLVSLFDQITKVEIDENNQRIRETKEQQEAQKIMINNSTIEKYVVSGTTQVYGSAPIYDQPNSASSLLCYARNGTVYVLGKVKGNFYYVRYGNKEGYMSKGWIK
jgi:hypothetical protein